LQIEKDFFLFLISINNLLIFLLFSFYIYMTTTPIETVQTFKILIIGDSNVGKTSLMNRLVHGIFSNNYSATIGVDFKIAMINIGDYKCRLQIWFV
jgi:GTPase SAR1 family protein